MIYKYYPKSLRVVILPNIYKCFTIFINMYNKEYYLKNREKIIAYRRKYYQDNKAKISRQNKTYFQKWYNSKGKEWMRNYMREYMKEHNGRTRTENIKV
jgi:hypothetical protein